MRRERGGPCTSGCAARWRRGRAHSPLPTRTIPSAALAISAVDGEDVTRRLSAAFRSLPTPVIGYVHKGRLLLDLRCLEDEEGFAAQLETLRL